MSRVQKIVSLNGAIFRKFVDYKSKPKVFPNPISLEITKDQKWAVMGEFKQEFMKILAGEFIVEPVNSRKYPQLEEGTWPTSVIEFLQFSNNNYGKSADGTGNGGFTHLGARYETFKDLEIDIKASSFICDLSYNSAHVLEKERLDKLLDMLQLRGLENKFINSLSNGQFRRARIAKALYKHTQLLLLDDPFLGLDPTASKTVSTVLEEYSQTRNIVVGLRIQDEVPEWVDHIAIVNEQGVVTQGHKDSVKETLAQHVEQYHAEQQKKKLALQQSRDANREKFEKRQQTNLSRHEVMIEFDDLNVEYLDKTVIKNLNWKVTHGEKWHIRGNNGTGKTTILALITLDHPQSWNSKVALFGQKRKTGKTNYFDTNKEIGFTSPELHALWPKQRTVFETIGNGFEVGNYLPPANLTTDQVSEIETLITDFGYDNDTRFKDLTTSDQKVVLFLRAIVKKPKILILDEAFSAMTENSIEKCKEVVNTWNHGGVLVIGHVPEEVPQCDKYLQLIDPPNGVYETGICE